MPVILWLAMCVRVAWSASGLNLRGLPCQTPDNNGRFLMRFANSVQNRREHCAQLSMYLNGIEAP